MLSKVKIYSRQLVFSYDWLPIYSLNDFYRVKDMVAKSFEEFSHKTHRNQFMSQKTPYAHSKQFDEIYTVCETDKFNLNCLEDLQLFKKLTLSTVSAHSREIRIKIENLIQLFRSIVSPWRCNGQKSFKSVV
jgi:hypothetical protein